MEGLGERSPTGLSLQESRAVPSTGCTIPSLHHLSKYNLSLQGSVWTLANLSSHSWWYTRIRAYFLPTSFEAGITLHLLSYNICHILSCVLLVGTLNGWLSWTACSPQPSKFFMASSRKGIKLPSGSFWQTYKWAHLVSLSKPSPTFTLITCGKWYNNMAWGFRYWIVLLCYMQSCKTPTCTAQPYVVSPGFTVYMEAS